jgi:transposase
MRLEPHRLIFLDETRTTTKMTRLRGRCPMGRRLLAKAPFGHWKTQTFITGLRYDALTAPFVIDAPMDRRIFETYGDTQLAPTLKPGDIVISDNLAAHKSAAAEKAIRAKGAWLLFLPPYSPDLNPIEMAFAKTESASARQSDPHHRRPVARHRRNLRPLQSARMPKLLRRRRIWTHMMIRRARSLSSSH